MSEQKQYIITFSLYCILCYFLYLEYSSLLYMTIALPILYKHKQHNTTFQISITIVTVVVLNFTHIFTEKPLISPQSLGYFIAYSNILIICFTNIILQAWIFYVLYCSDQNISDANIFKEPKLQFMASALTILIGIIYLNFKLEYFHIILIISICFALLLAKTFTRDLCLWLAPLVLISLLFSIIACIPIILFLIENETAGLTFNIGISHLASYQVTSVLQIIFLLLPRKFFPSENDITFGKITTIIRFLSFFILFPELSPLSK